MPISEFEMNRIQFDLWKDLEAVISSYLDTGEHVADNKVINIIEGSEKRELKTIPDVRSK